MFYFYATAINKLANLCHHIPRLAKIFCNFTTFLLLLKLTKKALNMTQKQPQTYKSAVVFICLKIEIY